MGFNSHGVYTPPAGATTAAPGDVIQSAVWNSIFSDLSSALTLLGQQLYNTTSVASSPYTVLSTDTFILVNTGTTITIDLLLSADAAGYPVTIKDSTGTASTNNITITAAGSDTIEGDATLLINTDYGGYILYPISGGWVLRP